MANASIINPEWSARLDKYQSDHQQITGELRRLVGRWNRLSYVRGALFLLSLALGFCVWQDIAQLRTLWIVLVTTSTLAFLWIMYVHDQIERAIEDSRLRMRFLAEAVARCRRQWNQITVPPLTPLPDSVHRSRDLDLFGSSSLTQLLGTAKTVIGLQELRNWICRGAGPSEIAQRQSAVADLSGQTEWRESFQLACDRIASSACGADRFLEWARSKPFSSRYGWLIWTARILAAVAMVLIIGFVTGWLPATFSGVGIIAVVIINFGFSVGTGGTVHEIFGRVASRKNEVDQYLGLFRQIQSLSTDSPWLSEEQNRALGPPGFSLVALGRLSRVVWCANLHRNGILFLAYVVLQFFFLWDLHVVDQLERWQKRYRAMVGDWFMSLARIESAAALATFAYENPEFKFPEVRRDFDKRMVARAMGHPLLPQSIRVCNDVELGPAGRVLLVTGSNMSGKSTLLRSIGVNVVLAQMGSVVCADELKLHPVAIETSMRIADSLADGVSFFMAELNRLKQIVDRSDAIAAQKAAKAAAKDEGAASGDLLLFLLDEVLQGTNSRERHIAVTAVVSQLLRNGAFGAVTTHDLDLARAEDLGKYAETVYFSETFVRVDGREEMTFDYVMRAGVAPTTNAIKLLRLVGLQCDDPPA